MNRDSIGYMRSLLLLLLLVGGESHGWILGGKKGGKDAPTERKKVTQAKLPPSTFVRIFALPSDEAKMAQVCSFPGVGACKLCWPLYCSFAPFKIQRGTMHVS